MKNLWLVAAFFLLLGAHSAAAFSIDQSANQNTDGSQKFNDPDDQMPALVVSPDNNTNGINNSLTSASPVTMPSMGEYDNGAQAFDQAFAHQDDK